jgi:DNA-binding MarR family transcriptional regulator
MITGGQKNNRRLEQVISEELNVGIDSPTSVNVFVKKENSAKFESEYLMVFQDFLKMAAQYRFTNKATYQLLIAIMGYAKYGNGFSLDISDMSNATGHNEKTIRRAIKELLETQILSVYKNINDKRRNDYYINPNAVWKGTSQDRKIFIDAYQKENESVQLKMKLL